MDNYYSQRKTDHVIMAEKDLTVLRDLFHTFNDVSINYAPLNSSIALLEKYIEDNRKPIIDVGIWPEKEVRQIIISGCTPWKNNGKSCTSPMV